MAQTVRPHGYHVVISSFEEDPALEASDADSLLARQVDWYIVASSQPPDHLDVFKLVHERNVPYVLIDRPIRDVSPPSSVSTIKLPAGWRRSILSREVAFGSAICVVLKLVSQGATGGLPPRSRETRLSSPSALHRVWRAS